MRTHIQVYFTLYTTALNCLPYLRLGIGKILLAGWVHRVHAPDTPETPEGPAPSRQMGRIQLAE